MNGAGEPADPLAPARELPFQAALRERCARPLAAPLLLAVNVAVFAVMALAGAGLVAVDPQVHVRFGSNYGPLTLSSEPWRLLTCMFIHFGLLHLAFNMWALWDVGRLVERLYGTASFVLLYFVAGLAGSITSVLWNPAINAAGASGALFGVVGALLAFVFRPDLGLPPMVVRALRNSMLAFTGFSLALGAVATGIDNAAHLGGLATGLIMGFVLARPLVPGQDRRSAFVRFAAAMILGTAALGLALQPVLHPAPRIAAEGRFLLDIDWLAGREAEVAADFRALGNLGKAGRITPDEFAHRVAIEIMPRWREVEERLQGSTLPPESEQAPLQAALRAYIGARSRQFELLSQPLDPRDPAALRRIEAQAAVVELRRKALLELQAR